MKDALKTSKMLAEGRKMTLKGYYQSLPSSTHPKTEFINEITKGPEYHLLLRETGLYTE